MAQLNKMAFLPEICYFIRKCAIIMTWLQIKIAILLHIYLKVAVNGILEQKFFKNITKSNQTLNFFPKS